MKPANIQVRLTDIDILGHVNNAIYLSYFEMTRIHYFNQIINKDWDWIENGVVLVQNEVNYLHPIYLYDVPLIYMYLEHLGNKSFTLSYEIYVSEQLKTTGKSTLVGFNSKIQKSIEIPELMRLALLTLPKQKK